MIIIHAPHLDLHIGSVRRAHTVLLYELPFWIYKSIMGQCSKTNERSLQVVWLWNYVSDIERHYRLRPETEDWTCIASLKVWPSLH